MHTYFGGRSALGRPLGPAWGRVVAYAACARTWSSPESSGSKTLGTCTGGPRTAVHLAYMCPLMEAAAHAGRRLHVTSIDPERLQGDLRATNRQDSIDAAAVAGSSVSRRSVPFCVEINQSLGCSGGRRDDGAVKLLISTQVPLPPTFALPPPRSFRPISSTSSPREASRNTTRRAARRSSRCSSASAPFPFRMK